MEAFVTQTEFEVYKSKVLPVVERSNTLVEKCRADNKSVRELVRRNDEVLCEKLNKNQLEIFKKEIYIAFPTKD